MDDFFGVHRREHWQQVVNKDRSMHLERYAGVSPCGGALYLNSNCSPLESTLAYESWEAAKLARKGGSELDKFGDTWELTSEKSARYHLANTDSHRPYEMQYWALRSGARFAKELYAAVDGIEDHIWRWMLRGELSTTDFEPTAVHMLDAHFGSFWLRLRDNAQAIEAAAPLLDNPTTTEVLRKTHAEISGEMQRIERILCAMVDLFQTKPTTIAGFLRSLKALNHLREQVGMAIVPTPFGMKRGTRRTIKAGRRLFTKALSAFSQFAHPSEVESLAKGDPIWAQGPGSSIRFKLTTGWHRHEFQAEGGLYVIENDRVAPEVEIYTTDNQPLAQLCVYIDSTPLVDQVTGMKLLIESGHEATLVTTGNWYNIQDRERFEELVASRFNPVHLIDGYNRPETRRPYGTPCNPVAAAGDFQYDPIRFEPLKARARTVAMAWLWSAIRDHPDIIEIDAKCQRLLWATGPRERCKSDDFCRELISMECQTERALQTDADRR